jgi:hypothetical protein
VVGFIDFSSTSSAFDHFKLFKCSEQTVMSSLIHQITQHRRQTDDNEGGRTVWSDRKKTEGTQNKQQEMIFFSQNTLNTILDNSNQT